MLRIPLLFVVLCLTLALPCLARSSFVYVSNYGDGTISQFRESSNGMLTPLHPPTVKAHILCHSLAAARGRFLYAGSALDWSKRHCLVSQFRIAANGTLHSLSPARVFLPDTPASIAVEPTGRFAYVFNREGTVTQFRIKADGQLLPLSPAVLKVADAGGITPIVGFDKAHHVLYGAYYVAWLENVTSGTFACVIKSNGQLQLSPGSAKSYDSSQAYSISVSPNGRYAYVSESLRDKRLAAQWRDVVAQSRTRPGGSLTPLSPQAVTVETAGKSFVDPSGHFLYLLYEKTNDINATASYCLAYAAIGPNSRLGRFGYQTLQIPAPVPPVQDFSLAFDHAGHFCYFAEGNYLYLFRRQPSGLLSPLRPSRLGAGYGPLGIACIRR